MHYPNKQKEFSVLHLINEGKIGGREKQLFVMLQQNQKYSIRQEVIFEKGVGYFYDKIKSLKDIQVHVIPKKTTARFSFIWSKCQRADLIILHSPSICFLVPLFFTKKRLIYRLSGTVVTLVKPFYQENNKGFIISKSAGLGATERTRKPKRKHQLKLPSPKRFTRIVRMVMFLYIIRYRTHYVWSLSKYLNNIAQNYYGVPASKIVSFAPAIDPLTEQKRLDEAPNQITNETFNIVYIGRFISRKRIDRVLTLAGALRDQNITFWIVGYGEEEERLRTIAQKLNLEKVHFIAKTGNPYSFLKNADIFIYPSEHEPFGNAIVEAMFAKVPVIIFPPCGAAEMIQNGKNGFIVQNEEEMRSVVQSYFNHPQALKQIGLNGRETVVSYLSADQIFRRFFQLVITKSSS